MAAALMAATLGAQQTTPRPVTITVTDPTGAGIAHAQIRLTPAPDPAPAKMETDSQGRLRLELKAGPYALFVSAQGFQTAKLHADIAAGDGRDSDSQVIPVALSIGAVSSPTPIYPENSLVLTADPYHAPVALSPAEFRALPHVTVKVHNGHSNADETFSGVPLDTLLTKVNAPIGKELRHDALACYLIASGSDGYSVVLSLAEVDPSFHGGQVVVADARDGKPLGTSGPYQLVVPEDLRPARWVRNLRSIALESMR